MLHFRKPTPKTIQIFLEKQRDFDFTYREADVTDSTRFDRDHTRVKLGEGTEVFAAAKTALQQWKHFQLGWVDACPSDTPIQTGHAVAVLARQIGLWWLNACRIINVVDNDDKQYGFTYGTLPEHVESGEERFLIEMDQAGNVWYDILAFSRPRHIMARLGYVYARRVQERFRKQSAAAMCRAVEQ